MPNRYICTVLEEMRSCVKTHNFSYLEGLIEEAQSLANRMEAKLHDYKEQGYVEDRLHDLKKEKSELEAQIRKLKTEKDA